MKRKSQNVIQAHKSKAINHSGVYLRTERKMEKQKTHGREWWRKKHRACMKGEI